MSFAVELLIFSVGIIILRISRAQQVERDREASQLAVVTEVDAALEGIKSPPQSLRPKPSPKPRLFSALKKDGRARSNSSVLSIRRFSTEGILGDRLDSIGRRLSRDLANSPPDFGRKFDAIVKVDSAPSKFDTISGPHLANYDVSKSNEGLSIGRYDTFSGKTADRDLSINLKKKRTKRPAITFESYHPDKSDRSPDDSYEYELPAVKEGLEPPICHEDRGKAVLRHQLHKELRDKYGTRSTELSSAEEDAGGVGAIDGRPPLPRRNHDRPRKHRRQKSMDNLDVTTEQQLSVSPRSVHSTFSTEWTSPRRQMSTERMSREDLLRLSAETEIHEYLKKSISDRPADPP